MAKNLSVKYLGEEETITESGFTFEKGKTVQVPADHPRAAKFANNPTFEVRGDPEEPIDPAG